MRVTRLMRLAAARSRLLAIAFAFALAIAPITWAASDPATESETEPSPEKASQPKGEEVERVVFDIDEPPRTRYRLIPFWRYGANATLEFDFEKDFDLDTDEADNLSVLQPDLQFALSYDPSERFHGFLNLSLDREIALLEEGRDKDRSIRLRIKRAYVTIEEVIDGLSLQIGRQRIREEREWLYDEELDAVRLFYRYARLGLEASVSRRKLVDQDLLNEDFNERINNYFFMSRYRAARDLELAAYVLVRDDRSSEEGRPIFLGLRALGEAFHDLEYWVDFGHVRGRAGRDDGTQDDIRAFGFDVGATYAFDDVPLEPALTLAYAFGTGDSDPSDGVDHDFRQTGLQDNNGRFNGVTKFKYYGELFDPELSNLAILTAGFGIRPSRRSSLDVVFHHYRQDERSDEIRDTDVDEDPTGLSRSLGNEVDLVFGFREFRDVSIEVVVGYFLPGEGFPEEADDALLGSLEFRYRF